MATVFKFSPLLNPLKQDFLTLVLVGISKTRFLGEKLFEKITKG